MKFVRLPTGIMINPKMIVQLEEKEDIYLHDYSTIITMVDGSYHILEMSIDDARRYFRDF